MNNISDQKRRNNVAVIVLFLSIVFLISSISYSYFANEKVENKRGIPIKGESKRKKGKNPLDSALEIYYKMKPRDDSSYVDLLINIERSKSYYAYTDTTDFFSLAFNIAKKINYQKGIGLCYLVLAQKNNVNQENKPTIENYNKAIDIFKKYDDGSNLGMAYIGLGYQYIYGNPDKTLEYFSEAEKIYLKLNDKKGLSKTYLNMGDAYGNLGNLKKAKYYWNKNMDIDEEIGNYWGVGAALTQLGWASLMENKPDEAQQYFFESIYFSKEYDNFDNLIPSYENLIVIHSQKGNFDSSFYYSNLCLELSKQLHNKPAEAKALLSVGKVYNSTAQTDSSVEYFFKAVKIADEVDAPDIKFQCYFYLGNLMGIVNKNYLKSIEYYNKVIDIAHNNKVFEENLPLLYNYVGINYYNLDKTDSALKYFNKSLELSSETISPEVYTNNLQCIGNCYHKHRDYDKSLEYDYKALNLHKKSNNIVMIAHCQANIATVLNSKANDSTKNYPKKYKDSLLNISVELLKESLKIMNANKMLDQSWQFTFNLADVYSSLGNWELAYNTMQTADSLKDSVFKIEKNTKISELQATRENEIKQKEIQILKQKNQIQDLNISKQNQQLSLLNTQRKIQSLELDKRNFEIKRKNDELNMISKDKYINELALKQKNLENQNNLKALKQRELEISASRNEKIAMAVGLVSLILIIFLVARERNRSEKLLLNILPKSIAVRLKKKEKLIADSYDSASVVFIDIVDFTKSSSGTDPKRVVEVLNILYSKLDTLAKKHGLEKIKTIGDCYMAAAGVPEIRTDNAEMAAKFALEAMTALRNYDTGDGTLINFRCGLDSGPLVAGVIGENKFIYDIWGDTVNTAARMEEYSEPGKIQVTERFKEKLTVDSSQLSDKRDRNLILATENRQLATKFDERGEIEIKGKGKMRTWFLIEN